MKLSTVAIAVISLAIPGSALIVSEKRQLPRQAYNIHPNGDTSKCVGVSNGILEVGSAVTIFDCNGSPSQKWAWWDGYDGSPLFVTNPATNKRLCMNVANPQNFGNGAKLQLTNCRSTEGAETWDIYELFAKPYAFGDVYPDIWFAVPVSGNYMCLDLTDGSKENRNVLQLWQCSPYGQPTYKNQIWSLTAL